MSALTLLTEVIFPGGGNPNPTSDQKRSFLTPVFRPDLLNHTHSQTWSLKNYVIIKQQQKRFLKIHFEFAYFSFFPTPLDLKQ